jgi:Skp family chaperone for outer membrane proteins
MKTKSLVALTAALMLTCAPAAFAAETVNIAIVNFQKIIRDSNAAKSVREQVESKQKAYQNELTKKGEELRKEEQELSKQRSVLSKDAFEKKAAEFRKKTTTVQKEAQGKKAALDGGIESAISEIQKATAEVIADIAKEKNITVALPSTQVLYSDSKLDITDAVMEALNKKLAKLDVKFEEAKPEKK